MYLGYQNNKVRFYTDTPLDKELYNLDKVEQTDKEYVISPDGTEFVLKDEEYEKAAAEARKAEFLKEFFPVQLDTNLVEAGYAYYRRQPKGYQSAVESMNVLFNINTANSAAGNPGLPAGLIIFYQEPDFTKAEECTEDWLVQHQIVLPALSAAEFMQLYVAFNQAWAKAEH